MTWLNFLVDITQIQGQRLWVVDAFLLGPYWGKWWNFARLHQQLHQVLPKDIPAVLLEQSLAHVIITEGQDKSLAL